MRRHDPLPSAQCKSAQRSASHAACRPVSPLPSPGLVPGPPALRRPESQCLPPPHQHFLSQLFPSQLSHGHWPTAPSPLAGPSSSPSQNPSPVRPLLTCAADTVPHPFTMATLFKGQLLYRNDFHSNIGMSREDYNLGEDPSELHVTPRSRCHSIVNAPSPAWVAPPLPPRWRTPVSRSRLKRPPLSVVSSLMAQGAPENDPYPALRPQKKYSVSSHRTHMPCAKQGERGPSQGRMKIFHYTQNFVLLIVSNSSLKPRLSSFLTNRPIKIIFQT